MLVCQCVLLRPVCASGNVWGFDGMEYAGETFEGPFMSVIRPVRLQGQFLWSYQAKPPTDPALALPLAGHSPGSVLEASGGPRAPQGAGGK